MDNNKLSDLKQPLLDKQPSKPNHIVEDDGYYDPKEYDKFEILKKIFSLSIYPIIGMVFHSSHYIVNTIILGQNGANSNVLLASLGLGSLTLSSIVFALSYTFNGGLSTLISQAYGQKDYRLCALYLNRQVLLNIAIYIPLSTILWFSERIYLLMGFDPYIALISSQYVKIILPSHLLLNISNCYTRYLASQREVRFGMVTNIITGISHIPIVYYLNIYYDHTLTGVAVATAFNYVLRILILFTFIRFSRFYPEFVSMFHPDNYHNLLMQLKMSGKSASMGIWAWWAFDMFAVISTFMSVNDLAAQTVCRNIVLVFYMIPVGLSQASTILVGNSIGSKHIKLALLDAKMCMVTAFIWSALCVLIMTFFKQNIILAMSSSEDVNKLINDAFLILQYYVLIETIQTVSSGTISGIGKQGQASIYTLFGFWILGIPFSLVYVFVLNGGILGLWIGASLAMTFNFICYQIIIAKSDFHKIAEAAEQRRLKEQKLPQ